MSDNKFDVRVFMRSITLNVVIPELHVWEFMGQFGENFATTNFEGGGKQVKAVDNYYNHPNGWHVIVTVSEHEEFKFYQFLSAFCHSKKIIFRGAEQPEFDVNYLAYNNLRSDQNWLSEHQGMWVVFADGELITRANEHEEALKQSHALHPEGGRFCTKVQTIEEDEVIPMP